MFSNNKVKFQDHQLDDYVLENSVLKSKLQSKIDALSIMSRELDKCRMERDKYKVLVEQLKLKTIHPENEVSRNIYRYNTISSISGSEMLAKTRDHNNLLKLEVETLRSKLEEASGDILAMRKQLQRKDNVIDDIENFEQPAFGFSNSCCEDPQELEKLQNKFQEIQSDYRALLDEKEELSSDRDYYKNKAQRLSYQISFILSSKLNTQRLECEEKPLESVVDLDGIITENKYLHERITQLQVEKEIIKRTLAKYKNLLENRNKSGRFEFKNGITADVMTQKQVREFLDVNSKTGLKRVSVAELKSICHGLFEALNDKSIALQHQRKTNQILANRITELEKTLESWCSGQKCVPLFPVQMLLEEIIPDSISTKSETKEIIENIENTDKYLVSDEEKDSSPDHRGKCEGGSKTDVEQDVYNTKTVLPLELEELVQEALAELKPDK